MNENMKIGIAAILGFAVGFGISKMMEKNRKADKTAESLSEERNKDSEARNSKKVKDTENFGQGFPLKLGSKGHHVKRFQIHLMRHLGWVRKPDGVFDITTQKRALKMLGIEEVTEDLYRHLELDKMLHDQRKKRAS